MSCWLSPSSTFLLHIFCKKCSGQKSVTKAGDRYLIEFHNEYEYTITLFLLYLPFLLYILWKIFIELYTFISLQIFIHNPHTRNIQGGRLQASGDNDVSLLNINQSVSALCAGKLNPDVNNDVLVIGTPTNLIAYDVQNNSDLFYKDVSNFWCQL